MELINESDVAEELKRMLPEFSNSKSNSAEFKATDPVAFPHLKIVTPTDDDAKKAEDPLRKKNLPGDKEGIYCTKQAVATIIKEEYPVPCWYNDFYNTHKFQPLLPKIWKCNEYHICIADEQLNSTLSVDDPEYPTFNSWYPAYANFFYDAAGRSEDPSLFKQGEIDWIWDVWDEHYEEKMIDLQTRFKDSSRILIIKRKIPFTSYHEEIEALANEFNDENGKFKYFTDKCVGRTYEIISKEFIIFYALQKWIVKLNSNYYAVRTALENFLDPNKPQWMKFRWEVVKESELKSDLVKFYMHSQKQYTELKNYDPTTSCNLPATVTGLCIKLVKSKKEVVDELEEEEEEYIEEKTKEINIEEEGEPIVDKKKRKHKKHDDKKEKKHKKHKKDKKQEKKCIIFYFLFFNTL